MAGAVSCDNKLSRALWQQSVVLHLEMLIKSSRLKASILFQDLALFAHVSALETKELAFISFYTSL